MRTRQFITELNVVSEIDNLIMQLTYKKKGTALKDELKKGVKIIELIISFSEKSKGYVTEENTGYYPFHERQNYYSGKYNVEQHKAELENAKSTIEKCIKNKKDSTESDIENIQKLLLKISVPIWKEEVSILKPRHYKSAEM